MTLLTLIGMGVATPALVTVWFWLRWALPLLPTEDQSDKVAALVVARILTVVTTVGLAMFVAVAVLFSTAGHSLALSLGMQVLGWATLVLLVVALLGMGRDIARRILMWQGLRRRQSG